MKIQQAIETLQEALRLYQAQGNQNMVQSAQSRLQLLTGLQ